MNLVLVGSVDMYVVNVGSKVSTSRKYIIITEVIDQIVRRRSGEARFYG